MDPISPEHLQDLQEQITDLQRQIFFVAGIAVVALFAGTMNFTWSVVTLGVAILAEHWWQNRQ